MVKCKVNDKCHLKIPEFLSPAWGSDMLIWELVRPVLVREFTPCPGGAKVDLDSAGEAQVDQK